MRWSTAVKLSDTEYEEYLREGCRFAGRCPLVVDICKQEVPADVYVDDVLVKCHEYAGYQDTLSSLMMRLSEKEAEL